MAARTTGWLVGAALIGSAVSVNAMADDGPFQLFNPLGVYAGAGVGRSDVGELQIDPFGDSYHRFDGDQLGWNAVVGLRPIPFLGAEAEYIDFGRTGIGAGLPSFGPSAAEFYNGNAHDRAAAIFAVGYLPLPIPWVEPFAKLGWAQLWEHSNYDGYLSSTLEPVSVSQTSHPNGTAYGAGVQFHFEQLAVRAQYERISGTRSFGDWNNPSLLSVGLNWTF